MILCVFKAFMFASPIFAVAEATTYTGGYVSFSAVTDTTKRSQMIAAVTSKDVKNISDVFPNIVGGEPADDNEFPWFGRTAIVIKNGNNTFAKSCGGSLIYSDIVVTAASCIVDNLETSPDNEFAITFYLGANNFTGADGTPFEVKTVIWPSNYFFNTDDIAYYILSSPADIDPVQFNTNPSIPPIGAIGTTIGFGKTGADGEPSPVLLKVDLPSISNTECEEITGVELPDSITCSLEPEGDKATCEGDFGGPIIAADGTIFGITVFGGRLCSDYPTGFTRTSYFTDFTSKVRCDYSAFPPVGCVGFTPEPCGLFGLSIFCPFTFGGFIGRLLQSLFGRPPVSTSPSS